MDPQPVESVLPDNLDDQEPEVTFPMDDERIVDPFADVMTRGGNNPDTARTIFS